MPKANEHEAAVVDTLEVYGMDNILQVIDFLNGTSTPEPCFVDTRKEFTSINMLSTSTLLMFVGKRM